MFVPVVNVFSKYSWFVVVWCELYWSRSFVERCALSLLFESQYSPLCAVSSCHRVDEIGERLLGACVYVFVCLYKFFSAKAILNRYARVITFIVVVCVCRCCCSGFLIYRMCLVSWSLCASSSFFGGLVIAHVRLFWNQLRTKSTVCSDFPSCAF